MRACPKCGYENAPTPGCIFNNDEEWILNYSNCSKCGNKLEDFQKYKKVK